MERYHKILKIEIDFNNIRIELIKYSLKTNSFEDKIKNNAREKFQFTIEKYHPQYCMNIYWCYIYDIKFVLKLLIKPKSK